MKNISIVIPVHNEADNIGALISEIDALDLKQPYEIIIVDDFSRDDTYARVMEMKARIPELKVIQHERTYGQSAALATGIAHAVGELIVTMDGDGQNNPVDVPRLIDALVNSDNNNLRLVAGFRKKRNDSSWRILSSRLANGVRGFFLADQTPDTGCGLKVFYRSAFMSLPFFDHMHRFLPALIQMQGGDVISIEVSHRPRVNGTSKYGTLDRLAEGIIDLLGVSWLRLRAKRITIRRFA